MVERVEFRITDSGDVRGRVHYGESGVFSRLGPANRSRASDHRVRAGCVRLAHQRSIDAKRNVAGVICREDAGAVEMYALTRRVNRIEPAESRRLAAEQSRPCQHQDRRCKPSRSHRHPSAAIKLGPISARLNCLASCSRAPSTAPRILSAPAEEPSRRFPTAMHDQAFTPKAPVFRRRCRSPLP